MARYIKANPLVAQYLELQEIRNRVQDGNYILWQADIHEFGPLTMLPEILAQIGGIVLSPSEAREEQDGTVLRPLPVATDPRFIEPEPEETVDHEQEDEEQPEGGPENEQVEESSQEESQPESETENENQEEQPEAPAEEETPKEEQED